MQTFNSKPYPSFWSDVRKLFASLSPRRKWQVAGLFVLQLLSAASEVVSLGAVIPFLSALTNIDKLMADPRMQMVQQWTGITDSHQMLVLFAAVFGIAIVVANILRFLTLWVQLHLSSAIGTDMGMMLFDKMLRLPYSYHLRNNSSTLIGTLTNDLNGALGIVQSFLNISTQGLITLAIAGSLLIYNPMVAIGICTIAIAAYGLIVALITKRLHRNSKVNSDSYRIMIKALQEGLGGIRYITLGRFQKFFVSEYEKADRPFRSTSAENNLLKQAPRYAVEAIGVVTIAIVAVFITTRAGSMGDAVSLMGFLALGAYRLLPSVQQVYTSISTILVLVVPLHRTVEMMCLDLKEAVVVENPMLLKSDIVFENVWFDYNGSADKEEWTLKDINFTIKAHTTVAFVGLTGSGKSTTSDLILGLMNPQQGRLIVDGVVLTEELMPAWQAGIAHVPQAIFLTDNSIAQNIAFGVPKDKIDFERVKKAAEQAKIHDFIMTLPHGYEELVGERGVRLSGGQIQRIGIARALYQKPSMIVFDEATSALDNRTEKEVMEAIEDLGKQITIVLIAHRLSTIQKADRIFVFDAGRIVAQGTYSELENTCPPFSQMIKAQVRES